MSFDPETDNLWIGDVGQSHREEINVVNTLTDAGTNFGWNRMEGNACFKPRNDCDTTGITMPIEDYPPRSGNCSIIGGYVYRGTQIPTLTGYYTYTDSAKETSESSTPKTGPKAPQPSAPSHPKTTPTTTHKSPHSEQTTTTKSTPPLRRPHPQTSLNPLNTPSCPSCPSMQFQT